MRYHLFLIAIIAIAWAGRAPAEIVTISLPGQDATLYDNPTGATANGSGQHLFIGRTNQGSNNRRRALAQFDIGALIGAGSTINTVSVTLNLNQTPPGQSTQLINMHRVTSSWTEGPTDAGNPGGTGAPADAGSATWLHRTSPGLLWNTAGGDFVAASSASQTVNETIGNYTWSGSGLVADVQQWVDNPATNFGWMFVGNESVAQTAMRFSSSESAANRPSLTIDFTAVPEPTFGASVLLTLGLVSIRRRR